MATRKTNCAVREWKRLALQHRRATIWERIREDRKLPELPPSELVPLADTKGRRCEVCDRPFQNRKPLSRHKCVSTTDAKTGKRVDIPAPTLSSVVPLVNVISEYHRHHRPQQRKHLHHTLPEHQQPQHHHLLSPSQETNPPTY